MSLYITQQVALSGLMMENCSNSGINSEGHIMEIKKEIKEEADGILTKVKSESEGNAHFHSETVFVSSLVKESGEGDDLDNNVLCKKIEIKEEPFWPETTSIEIKQEMPSTADAELLNEKKETTLVDGVAEDFAETESQRSNSEAASSEDSDTSRFCTVTTWEINSSITQDNEVADHEGSIKPYKCEICDKSFKKKSNLKRHNMIHEDKKLFSCKSCGKGFQRSSNLKQHFMIHKGLRPYKCEICGRSFMQAERLDRHKILHVEEKPLICKVCGKGFMQLGYLNRHSIVHKDIRPYKCEVCGKSFKQSSHLKGHSYIHDGTRPHKCEICKTRFQRLSNLKKHSLIHEGVKPHKCGVCDKSFYSVWEMRRHKVGVHEKPHKCEICGKGFLKLSELKKHQLMNHEGKESVESVG